MVSEESNVFELLVRNAMKIPGVKVDRKEFLHKNFSQYLAPEKLFELMENGPLESSIDEKIIQTVTKNVIGDTKLLSSSASFVAGLPGGIALAATIPADTMQFFGMVLKLSQEIGYLYGYEDFWDKEEVLISGDLILFLGVMFDVEEANTTIKVLSSNLPKEVMEDFSHKDLLDRSYLPLIKKMAGYIDLEVTKNSFTKGVSKAIPVVGGVVSGSLTYSSMTKMGNRLLDALEENRKLSVEDFMISFEKLRMSNLGKKEVQEDFDVVF